MMAAESAPAGRVSRESLRRARMLWEQSGLDLKEARRRMRARAYLDSCYLSFQAALNALSTVCFLQGEFQFPSFSAVQLAALCERADPRFSALQGSCRFLEEVQGRGPFDPQRDEAEEKVLSRLCYDHGDSILRTVRRYLGDNRQRFFSP